MIVLVDVTMIERLGTLSPCKADVSSRGFVGLLKRLSINGLLRYGSAFTISEWVIPKSSASNGITHR